MKKSLFNFKINLLVLTMALAYLLLPASAYSSPQCTPQTANSDCLKFLDPQEAACNDISCDQNNKCHFKGHASGEYVTISEPHKQDHYALPTSFPPCTYIGPGAPKPNAYCTNTGMSSLDYCFPADNPRGGDSGTGTGTPPEPSPSDQPTDTKSVNSPTQDLNLQGGGGLRCSMQTGALGFESAWILWVGLLPLLGVRFCRKCNIS
jgi:hypothetical protein